MCTEIVYYVCILVKNSCFFSLAATICLRKSLYFPVLLCRMCECTKRRSLNILLQFPWGKRYILCYIDRPIETYLLWIHHGKTKVNPFNSLWFQWHWQSCICYRRDDNTVWTDPAVFLLHYNEHNRPIQTSLEVGKAWAHWPDLLSLKTIWTVESQNGYHMWT